MPNSITVITGHYGSGKTNFAVNLALSVKAANKADSVRIIDLDIVNPYFRTADFRELFKSSDIELVVSKYANSNLDIPALGFGINFGEAAYADNPGKHTHIIIDVGGDDAGATALGRYGRLFERFANSNESGSGIEMLYVVNRYRFLTRTPGEAAEFLREIELAVSNTILRTTGIVNNSNLGRETTAEIVSESLDFAEKVSAMTNLPVKYTCAEENLRFKADLPGLFPVKIYVNPYVNDH
ncbi:hypothetical protein FACS189499_04400 [Clostridia bacterium]|nr:hypothetical protein FACS189499_04400 [Clostridia bacterium]